MGVSLALYHRCTALKKRRWKPPDFYPDPFHGVESLRTAVHLPQNSVKCLRIFVRTLSTPLKASEFLSGAFPRRGKTSATFAGPFQRREKAPDFCPDPSNGVERGLHSGTGGKKRRGNRSVLVE